MAGTIDPNKLYDINELCQVLGMKRRTVERLTAIGVIPSRKVGRKVLYVGSDILQGLPKRETPV